VTMDDVEAERRQAGDVADAVGVVWPSIVEQFATLWRRGMKATPSIQLS
jgi:hypothetical protein